MITEIIIEQQRLDLFEDIGAELNYAIDDIKDFSARNTNYSKTINIPGNANNNKVFGHIYNFTSGNNYGITDPTATNVGYNFDPTKQANCQIFVNKIQVFKGVLRLLEITIQNGVIEYQCAVFGELGGFASAIGNKLLNDPEMFGYFSDEYDEVWNETIVQNSWSASGVASGLGIVYPLIDYGQCNNGHDWHLNAFRPAFFVHELIDKIIDFSGYTYTSAFFDTPYFRSLIIPNNKANLEQLTKDLLLVESTVCVESGSDVGKTDNVTFNLTQNKVLFSTLDYATYKFEGTNGTLGKLKLYGWFTISMPGTFVPSTFTIKVKYNGSDIITQNFEQNVENQNIPIDWIIDLTLNNLDTIVVQATFYTGVAYSTLCPVSLKLEFEADYATNADAQYTKLISMGNCLPKGIQQKDFFASICRMFNLYVYEDPQKSTHLLIEPYIEFYRKGAGFLKVNDVGELLLHGEPGDATGLLLLSDPTADSIDWSNKVDYSKEISIKPMSELNARYYDFVYTEDDDYYNEAYNKKYNESYGDRKYDSVFQFAEDRSEVKLIFSPSVLTNDSTDSKLRTNLFKAVEENNVLIKERKDNNIRIMFFKKVTTATGWKIKKETTEGEGNLTSNLFVYPYAGHIDDPILPTTDINYGVPNEVYFKLANPYPTANLFIAWWDEYLAEIINKDSKLLTCYLYLTVQDIHSLDFAQLIYIDGALWRLNKIVDFNPSIPQTTKCELLRVIELIYPS
jgi:hypothetical protein